MTGQKIPEKFFIESVILHVTAVIGFAIYFYLNP